ncbi:hypothetical protein [Pseudomonas chlororaphis]|uniref:hypothetical protein n=1 Tax=Pseudomonas chlororaphis TaxID=587753 RepID=UPI001B315B52|nr:hypothetical protein [Pseudomonas chlororaphis]MBP5054335.1 hypothetical protein [Pseudomonas chlororaphis]MBP5140292.1 hypothetical protein [Pseudomonas chlororaphis]QTT99513.1 hypothetical protein HUT26_09580 [Pseudomonas chlororaphis]
MPDAEKQAVKDVVEAVVGGDAGLLKQALLRLSLLPGYEFSTITGQLLDTEQREVFSLFASGLESPFYHRDGRVFGAVYTSHELMCKKANPSGAGLPLDQVREAVSKARGEHDEKVLKKALSLKAGLEELEDLLKRHSFADSKLTSLAHVELHKGQALLLAALNPINRG